MSETASARLGSTAADRIAVATFDSYEEAEAAVDYLSDQKFPVERMAIVGYDVKVVEQIIGRMDYGRAALSGAAAGAVPGALIGWLFGLFDWLHPVLASLTLAAYGLIFGAVVGALTGLLAYSLQSGRRDFTAVRGLQPSRYEIVADADIAHEATLALQQRPGAEAPPRSGEVHG
jgi:hypothetical protein